MRPEASVSRGTTIACSGSASSAATSSAMASVGTTVSGLRSSTHGARPAAIPWLAARAKPRLPALRIRRTRGWRSATASALPSLEALSTTTSRTSTPSDPSTDSTHPNSSARTFQLTMTTSTVGVALGSPTASPSVSTITASPARASPQPLQEGFGVGGHPVELEVAASLERSPRLRGEPVVERGQHAPRPRLVQAQLIHVATSVLDDEVAARLHERREVSERCPRGFVHVCRILGDE